MYSVYADNVCIYNDSFMLEDAILISPVLNLEKNAAGSFEFTIPSTNKAYSTITRLSTQITVKRDREEIWCGRIISEEMDFWKNRKVVCEGELAILNDTTQPMAEYHDITPENFLKALIANHNQKVSADKQFTVGVVTVTDSNNSLYRYTNYEKTIECINEKLIERLGGYLRIRKENGTRYIDYLADEPITNSQTINFGKNLLDFVSSWNEEEYATVILPFGARLETSPIESLEAYLTVESVNRGSKYVQNDEAVAQFGWIEKVVHWDEVTTPAALLRKAKSYLTELQFDNMTIEVSALDLHYINPDISAINLLDRIRVISEPHGLDKIFPVSKLEIPLDSPEETIYTLGTNIQTSLTSVNNSTSAAILEKIESIPTKQSVLSEARAQAKEVMRLGTTGYITIHQTDDGTDAMYISELKDYTKSDKYWRFNMNGLGFTKDGGENWGIAITMDGKIVADFITTGTMSADRIRAGTLKSINQNVVFDLDNGKLTMKAGSINIGNKFIVDESGNLTMSAGSINIGNKFIVDQSGNLTMKSGSISIGSRFSVDNSGNLVAKNADISGTIFAGDENGYWVSLNHYGELVGGNGTDTVGTIDYNVHFTSGATGMKVKAGIFVFSADGIAVKASNDDTDNGIFGGSGTLDYISKVEKNADGTYSFWTSHLQFRHGLMITSLE